MSANAQNYVSLAVEDVGRAPTNTTDNTSNTDKESTNNNNSDTETFTMNSNTSENTEENNQEMLDSLKKETILLKTQILELRKERNDYKKQVENLNLQLNEILHVISGPEKKKLSLKDASIKLLTALFKRKYSRYGDRRLGSELANTVWSKELFGGVTRMEIISIGKKYLQEHFYLPIKVLEALDLTGGKCNLKALMVLQSIETSAKDPYKDISKKA